MLVGFSDKGNVVDDGGDDDNDNEPLSM